MVGVKTKSHIHHVCSTILSESYKCLAILIIAMIYYICIIYMLMSLMYTSDQIFTVFWIILFMPFSKVQDWDLDCIKCLNVTINLSINSRRFTHCSGTNVTSDSVRYHQKYDLMQEENVQCLHLGQIWQTGTGLYHTPIHKNVTFDFDPHHLKCSIICYAWSIH